MTDKPQYSFKWLRWGVMLLLVGAVVVWVTSAWVAVSIQLRIGNDTFGIQSSGGESRFVWTSDEILTSSVLLYRFSDSHTTARSTLRNGFLFPNYGEMTIPIFTYQSMPASNQAMPKSSLPISRIFSLPLFWPVLLLFGTLVALSVVSRKAVRRMAEGHCPACGYDLRASVGACPECGHSIAASSEPRDIAVALDGSDSQYKKPR